MWEFRLKRDTSRNKKGLNFLIWNAYADLVRRPEGVKVGHVNQKNEKGRREVHGQRGLAGPLFVSAVVFRRWTLTGREGAPQGSGNRPELCLLVETSAYRAVDVQFILVYVRLCTEIQCYETIGKMVGGLEETFVNELLQLP